MASTSSVSSVSGFRWPAAPVHPRAGGTARRPAQASARPPPAVAARRTVPPRAVSTAWSAKVELAAASSQRSSSAALASAFWSWAQPVPPGRSGCAGGQDGFLLRVGWGIRSRSCATASGFAYRWPPASEARRRTLMSRLRSCRTRRGQRRKSAQPLLMASSGKIRSRVIVPASCLQSLSRMSRRTSLWISATPEPRPVAWWCWSACCPGWPSIESARTT